MYDYVLNNGYYLNLFYLDYLFDYY